MGMHTLRIRFAVLLRVNILIMITFPQVSLSRMRMGWCFLRKSENPGPATDPVPPARWRCHPPPLLGDEVTGRGFDIEDHSLLSGYSLVSKMETPINEGTSLPLPPLYLVIASTTVVRTYLKVFALGLSPTGCLQRSVLASTPRHSRLPRNKTISCYFPNEEAWEKPDPIPSASVGPKKQVGRGGVYDRR
ncbi:hypothetical protein BDD12DRAFT_838634 [Trichophaea hybrida]|nr:hypothetical protein BDD12DRAFT_838634 [Trichophaea hybrida]